MKAALTGHIKIVKVRLFEKTDSDWFQSAVWYYLVYSIFRIVVFVFQNKLFCLRKNLLDAGANMEAKDKKGFTPLMMAAYMGQSRVVEVRLLMENFLKQSQIHLWSVI